jgi:deoxyribodipyrimidine photo-lyase
VRRYVPELAGLPNAVIPPWAADAAALSRAGVVLGTTYPCPLVALAGEWARALAAYANMRRA